MPQSLINKRVRRSILYGDASVEVAFVIEITNSMKWFIENFVVNLDEMNRRILKILSESFKVKTVSVGFSCLGFGDLFEGEPFVMGKTDFSGDIDFLKSFLEYNSRYSGGEDSGKSSLDALYTAIESFKWQKPARIIILFTNAPPKVLHPSVFDNRKSDALDSISLIVDGIIQKNIRTVIFAPSDITEFRKIGFADKCHYYGFDSIDGKINEFNDKDKFLDNIIDPVSKIIARETVSISID